MSNYFVLGIEHGDNELLSVGLPSGDDKVLDQSVCQMGIVDKGFLTEGNGCILDQAYPIDIDGLDGRCGLEGAWCLGKGSAD